MKLIIEYADGGKGKGVIFENTLRMLGGIRFNLLHDVRVDMGMKSIIGVEIEK